MLRLGLSARVVGIVLVTLLCGWLALVARAYWKQDLRRTVDWPAPQRVAALVELAERTAPAERERLFRAVGSDALQAWVEGPGEGGGPAADGAPPAAAVDEEQVRSYGAALAPRPVAVSWPSSGGRDRPFPRPFRRLFGEALTPLVLRTPLPGGETLAVALRRPVPVTELGLPVGFAAGALGTLVALAALIVLHREIRPLVRLAAAVDRVDPTGAPVPLPRIATRAPEIRALVGAFDRLQGRLATLVRARLALIGGIQHDVRSFATRLRLRVDQIPDAEERARAEADIADMIALLDDALLASRAGARELDEELIEIAALVVAEIRDRREASNPVDVHLGPGAEAATVLGDRLALRRVVANLVANAVAYGRVAHVALAADPHAVTLTVDDEGPGIPADRRDLLCEPFVRLESSRARRTGGAGLGLAVARSLVEAHGGRLAIGDAPGGGARLAVTLPRFRPDDGGPAV
ncbi:sensor histidine kinase [Azospirillum sp. A39]|uniref:sensor histidine kinase n=1 Tax=Azospirillum sp. A39 TaxID=3462279 RepID=UPI004045E662